MPLLRYFTFVGGALLTLLFVASWYFPETELIKHNDVAKPVIRIASDRVGPPRVDFDTRVETAVVPAPVPDPVSVADIAQQAPAQIAEARPIASPQLPASALTTHRNTPNAAKLPPLPTLR